jgi:hypothetical protein
LEVDENRKNKSEEKRYLVVGIEPPNGKNAHEWQLDD